MEDQKQKTFNMEELRKKYPRAGMKWDKEEDERLKKVFEDRRKEGFGDFDGFIFALSQQFQRAAGGLKARMAMHFDDVPGWDYGRQEHMRCGIRPIGRGKLSKAKRMRCYRKNTKNIWNRNKKLIRGFLKRLSHRLGGVEGKFISHRLVQLQGTLEKYRRDDIVPAFSVARADRPEQEIPQLDFSSNPQMQDALRIMDETNNNLFLTGEAGTGKSTFLNYFRRTTEKNVVVLAPTGVAALNVEGQTIHSFCSFGPDITMQKVKKLNPFLPKFKLLQKLNTIVIDEISMVRADLLDFVDKFLRLNGPVPDLPFGGLQMVFIGDLYQLPPVDKGFGINDGLIKEYASPYFFDSRAFKNSNFNFIELKTIYRQKDQAFKDVLNAVRNNATTLAHMELLNQRAQAVAEDFVFKNLPFT